MRYIVAYIGAMLMFLATPALAQTRVALVIANDAYRNVPALKNPPSDAALIAASLRKAGFTSVETVRNLDKASLEAALQRFGSNADGADVAMVYYAGHGIEVAGRNFLVPVSARLLRDRDADFEAVPLDTVLRALESSRLRLVVLDACRENPFAVNMARSGAGRSVGRGLARVEPEGDTLVAYAARAGAIAADGGGTNSPFASALAKRILEPGVDVRLMFGRVRDDVMEATGRQQEPFTYGSLSGQEFYLAPRVAGIVSASVPAPSANMEALLWQGVMSSGSAEAYADYPGRYPNGAFAVVARERLKQLQAARTASSITSPTTVSQPGYLALKIQDLTDEVRSALDIPAGKGTLVAGFEKSGPADLAGVQEGDVVLALAGQDVTNDRQLPEIVGSIPAGQAVEMDLLRNGRAMTLRITPAARPADFVRSEPPAPVDPDATKRLEKLRNESEHSSFFAAKTDVESDIDRWTGLAFLPLDETYRKRIAMNAGAPGLIVNGVRTKSDASAKGLLRGDVIVSINNMDVVSAEQAHGIISTAKATGRKSLLLRVKRNTNAPIFLGISMTP